jgi:hypothetical protein
MTTEPRKGLRRDWTTLEEKKLRQHSERRSSVAEIEKALQRSKSSLRQKAHELGIALGDRRKATH